MTDAYQDSPPLTDEQLAVVEQPWDARVLVTADAGAGKTHTLVRRLDALCGHEDPEEALEAAEILVLTFSRAAARELRERIALHGERAHRVRARTFDAWAYEVLLQEHPDGEWGAVGFDVRIAAATRAIEKGALEIGDAVPPAHVVIDEVQDLLGGRRELVETLLDRYQDSCGFTVVGDAAQSVYGFQIEDLSERADETGRLHDGIDRRNRRASLGPLRVRIESRTRQHCRVQRRRRRRVDARRARTDARPDAAQLRARSIRQVADCRESALRHARRLQHRSDDGCVDAGWSAHQRRVAGVCSLHAKGIDQSLIAHR